MSMLWLYVGMLECSAPKGEWGLGTCLSKALSLGST